MYIVGFNGPPFSGKDTMARMLAEHMDSQGVKVPVVEVSLSSPLRRIAYMMVGRLYVPETYDDFKKEVFPQFNGATGRKLMIDVSERFLKLCYGKSIMAKMLLDELKGLGFPDSGVVLIRDSGFQCEIDPLVDAVGADNLMMVQVQRPGTSFEHDSREWVQHKHMYFAVNDEDLDKLRGESHALYNALTEFLGWKL